MIDHYELLTIFPGTKTEEEVVDMTAKLQQQLQTAGAAITLHEAWGKRKLAYEIKHIRHGYYDLTEFDFERTKLNELDAALRLNDTILRHQIVQKPVKTAEEIAAETALRERIAAKRQAAREKEQVAGVVGADPIPATDEAQVTAPAGPIEKEKLDEKLEQILDSDQVDI